MSSLLSELNYNSLTSNVRAVVTTQWDKRGYRAQTLRNIENYYVDTSLDNDADPWVLEIGDPDGDYLDLLKRDNEVQVQIFGVGSKSTGLPMLTGIGDEVTYGDEGVIRITGRDFSSLAIDSTIPPNQYKLIQAWRLVDQQARSLGFKRTSLAKTGPTGPIVKKSQYTDGSESYWEFWHRLYRKERMWIWTEPEGTLMAGSLKYEGVPRYYFGTPRRKDPNNIARSYIPVEAFGWRKTTQQRFEEIWVYGHKGDNGFLVKQKDPQLRHWIKRPRKIMLDSDANSRKSAIKSAWEEIFEGKVGALEFTLTIGDPGFPIDQNTVAVVNLPQISGEFFIVGTRSSLGPDGYVQEIRLREKQYAISRRVPVDPKISTTQAVGDQVVASEFASGISSLGNMPQEWGTYFVKAANAQHGPWDYNLFLATLLAICDQETAFHNIRGDGGPGGDKIEWYPWVPSSTTSYPLKDQHGRTKDQWQQIFANEPGSAGATFAVGPMQLYSLGYKQDADQMMGPINEFQGGRWHPEHNIMEAAIALRQKLRAANSDSGRDIDMWGGVSLYGHNAQLYRPGVPTPYAISVKNKVYNDPGYLHAVTEARQSARDAAAANKDVFTAATQDTFSPSTGFQNDTAQLSALTNLKRSGSDVDIVHVNYELLRRLNTMAVRLSKTFVITSGYRSYQEQAALYERYRRSGFNPAYIAAKPGQSNHERGQACDVTVGGTPLASAVPGSIMAIYGVHNSVAGDPVHTTLISVSG